jgi:type IV secretory pathway VirB10-like protein
MNIRNAIAKGICMAMAAQGLVQTSWGQTTPAPAPAPTPALAASVGLQAYPSKGQDAKQQNIDEGECYGWAKQNSGFDPGAPPPTATAAKVEAPPAQPTGARAKGAVRGAAAGAVVGEVANNDADQGARTGAAVGVVAGGARNRQARRAQEEQANQANAQAQAQADQHNAQNAQLQQNFKNGMKACLEGKGYTVK